MSTLLQDLRFGLRMLAKNPGFTLLVTGLLAVAIGATTVMFSLFDAVFLRTLPVRRPAELVRMVQHFPKVGARSLFPYIYYQALRDHATTLSATFGETSDSLQFAMSDPGPAEEITVRGVTPDFFNALGVQALYGRVLLPDDEKEGSGTPPAVLSYGFWRRRFGGNRGVVDEGTLLVNGHRFIIVGVMPRDFNGLTVDTTLDVRVPLRAYRLLVNPASSGMPFELAGRLKPGITRSQAQAECQVLWRSSMEDYYRTVFKWPPQTIARALRVGMQLESLAHGVSLLRQRYGDVLKLVMASVALLLLIVCANDGGLLLERAAARQPEITVRLAVGATRFRLVRQVLAENLLLAALGCTAGLAISAAGMPLVTHLLPPIRNYPSSSLLPVTIDIAINSRIFLFMLALCFITMLFFSASPVILISQSSLDALLRSARASAGMRGRQVLIALQIALCTFLLAIATLLARTFQHLESVNPGFDIGHVATFSLNLRSYTGKPDAFVKTFTERVREIPGVVSVATASVGVMRGTGLATNVAPEGQRVVAPPDFFNASLNEVSPEYFSTLGIHVQDGRNLTPSDVWVPKQAKPVPVVVNQAFVQRFFPKLQPLGKRVGSGLPGEYLAKGQWEVVGVVSDAKYRSLREPVIPTVYTAQGTFNQFVIYVRTRMRPEAIIAPVRNTLASLDPALPFLEVHTLAEEVDDSIGGDRITASLAAVFAGLAALLVGVGIYGLLAYVVTQRRREIGIRMALGAQRADIGKLIAGQTAAMTLGGIACGLAATLAAGPALRTLLYGVAPQDARSLIAAVIFVALTAATGALLPSVRAASVNPLVALRYE